VKLEAPFRGEFAKSIKMLAICSGIEFCGNDDHRLFGKSWTERSELMLDDFKIADGIAIVCVACIHQMRDQSRSLEVLQESDTETSSFVGAFDEARNVRNHKRAAIARRRIGIGGNNTKVRLKSREGVGGDFWLGSGDARNQRRLSGIRKSDEAHIREQFQLEPQLAFLTGAAFLVLGWSLVPWPHKNRISIATAAAPAARRAKPLPGLDEIEKLLT
jgi:hypothetical protein